MPAILRCFRIAGFLFSKEGCYITQNEVNAVFDEQVRLCADTLKRKTKEYTGDDPDRLGAFKAAAALQHTTPQRALAGMLAKHADETGAWLHGVKGRCIAGIPEG